jgi:hypothetical protein
MFSAAYCWCYRQLNEAQLGPAWFVIAVEPTITVLTGYRALQLQELFLLHPPTGSLASGKQL